MYDFFIAVFKLTFLQIFGLFGIFFILGFILSKLQEKTHKIYQQTIGWKGILWTAWVGTPFHEFGHYFFAKLFRHKIIKFKLFDPNQETGELGSVDHSFKKTSLYQRIGNFFIGVAPMIFGSIVLILLAYFFLPHGKELISILSSTDNITNLITKISIGIKNSFLSISALKSWNYWLFLYLSFCIASHLAPSKVDRKGMWSGFLYIIFILLLINIFGILFNLNPTNTILKIKNYMNFLTAIFLYSIIISTIHLLFAYILLKLPKKLISKR
ncbi:MAG: hypothetical protein A2725_03990 [Candidatus Magasanikbacteria bacterium RIFCSPHIGHO2_01_FULL_33_34]|uniref:Uncharacterized protein n=1 Tax=Candidatus Magasanikbacteria bacterium RIFCSPHIGHO2_01_FULL_33_34 TaxID=1798671 RepID=A0A1F6LHR3_9BACT|nr:MAG: hypothetical protein A2725_03990 [Candidatus Magasanikbacteria bacterium RIFCSPHIGHO2_01_FULL_33_34]OGH65129.1 MAG: hypothetical protein A3B83_03750 [Candidatus Magasanikbacteria bacterium RIFCSPHIGHO2_02_FULL_33_17]OGH75327.1 MAG: hypothetical protein A3A89_04415 [Candidatus Magasanikbacteria bacterium RIFCSPLOWO2_01_FULL_33_34]OGH82421.1 MAG: hypothetical protein A3F93_01795 [Candidatus Magasanikbacteria bacterium RIFCSPLOWO2_12_FULL_34_7]